jgi:hypothetical protein
MRNKFTSEVKGRALVITLPFDNLRLGVESHGDITITDEEKFFAALGDALLTTNADGDSQFYEALDDMASYVAELGIGATYKEIDWDEDF